MPNYIKCNLANKIWYKRHVSCILLPFSVLYFFVISVRKLLFLLKIKKTTKFNVPVIIVGNITVGGTGKTPLVIWLTHLLRKNGFTPGIISRGYKGKNTSPLLITEKSDVSQTGDEPLLIFQKTKCPVVIARKRVDAAKKLLNETNCDIIISDDGLQHYALKRDIEISVIDYTKKLGNGFLLPAGPLRERKKRLKTVDFVIYNGGLNEKYSMKLIPPKLPFKNKTVHAIAAIGNPKRFFDMLKSHSITVIEHPFPDHYKFKKEDVNFNDDLPILMTEKDAIKCKNFMNKKHHVISVKAVLQKKFEVDLMKKIRKTLKNNQNFKR